MNEHEETSGREAASRPSTSRFGHLAALCGVALLLGHGLAAQDPGASRIEGARGVLGELMETQRLISKEKREWALSREILRSRIEVVQREIAALRERIGEAEASIVEADEKRSELVQRHDALMEASERSRAAVEAFEARMRGLLARFPDPLQDVVRPLSQRLPGADSKSALSLSERYLTVVGILKLANKFQRDITVGSELRTLSDGSASEVTAMYLGLGQAYYANARGTLGGLGLATTTGWSWVSADAAAGDIARAIAIQGLQRPADFVQLPVRIQ